MANLKLAAASKGENIKEDLYLGKHVIRVIGYGLTLMWRTICDY